MALSSGRARRATSFAATFSPRLTLPAFVLAMAHGRVCIRAAGRWRFAMATPVGWPGRALTARLLAFETEPATLKSWSARLVVGMQY